MDGILEFFQKIIAVLISVFSVFTGLFAPQTSYEPMSAQELQLNAAVISDIHINEEDNDDLKSTQRERRQLLQKGLSDINRSAVATDVLAVVGDVTDGGRPEEFQRFFKLLSACDNVKLSLIALGNHDSWQGDSSFNSFFSEYGSFLGKSVTASYRHETANGYHFFVLGTEKKMQNQAWISQAQMDWFDAEMAKLVGTQKPVFLLLHQPFNGTNRVNEAWAPGLLGEQSDQLMSIVKKYTEQGMIVICFSGHLHSGLGYSGVTNEGNLYFVDCPSFGQTPARGDIIETGTGYVVEAYIGKIFIRARNFVTGKFYDKTYRIETNETVIPEEPTTAPSETTTMPAEQTTQEPVTSETTTYAQTLPVEIE